jgi:hypothetical protein
MMQADTREKLGSGLPRLTVMAAALVACWSVVIGAAPAGAAAQTTCSLWTHAQISALIDATKYNTTTSTTDHCAWQTPGEEVTANELQLQDGPVTASNTLVGKSGPALANSLGCTGSVVKPISGSGVLGYSCISALAISGAEMTVQKGNVQIAVSIVYGLPKFKVKSSALVADARTVLAELHA